MSDLLFSDQSLPVFSKIKASDINKAILSIIKNNNPPFKYTKKILII